ncbi:MAG: signal recognition particle-docking protein FtsY [Acidimicrobiia bacterium]|nr:signal recognition particle-docking protein FtsY [Acidimicrobiia bacterium]MYB25248.1 signal recognition particle-docking protein FtsY [Acidimicrobiia bacterium]MYE68346.1 signal recognition particle-docking protein FtsY [Acidimicrobiia bacterium]
MSAARQVPEAGFEALPDAPRWRTPLAKARSALGGRIGAALARPDLDEAVWASLEEALLGADVSWAVTEQLLERLRHEAARQRLAAPRALRSLLAAAVADFMEAPDGGLDRSGSPAVWLFVGVNGSGKTTTIGKLAHAEVQAGRRVVLAAADTFRAAATEQLAVWADRAGARLVGGTPGGDPAAVAFDAISHAAASGADVVMIDTAGRLHTDHNLMGELAKIRRVAQRASGELCESLLTLDATTGQNGLLQARRFGEAAGVTGAVLTKLDGSARGGTVLSVRAELGVAVKLVGLGEGLGDLVPFDASAFAAALLDGDGN